ncbi:uncharacterized protein LOC109977184 [Xyrichtys novacula]|uniref:Uncharacterized protein LOC109977184 n=1 Tax=Xyrichtys novacula TaxID=13765 RepID=A0AAV1ERA9_XYRNO|nr:uncharacterized protein LOC109977184 [Xyrichtys novacula]
MCFQPPVSDDQLWALLKDHKKKAEEGLNIPDVNIKQVEHLMPSISHYKLWLWLKCHKLGSLTSLLHLPIPDEDLKKLEKLKPSVSDDELWALLKSPPKRKPEEGLKIPHMDIKQVEHLAPSLPQHYLWTWLAHHHLASLGSLLHLPVPQVDLKQLVTLKPPVSDDELWALLKSPPKSKPEEGLKIPDVDIKQVEHLAVHNSFTLFFNDHISTR